MRAEARLTDCIDACAAEASEGCARAARPGTTPAWRVAPGPRTTRPGARAAAGLEEPADAAAKPAVKPAPKAKVRPPKKAASKRRSR